MSVERRVSKGGAVSYVVRWRAGGRQSAKSFPAAKLGGERKAERLAHVFDRDVNEQIATTGVVLLNRGAHTLADTWQQWFDDGCQRWTPETQEAYATVLDKHVLPRLGRMQVAAIRPATVEEWSAALKRDGVGPAAIQKATTALSSLLSWAVRAGMIDSNPVRVARKPSAPRVREPVKIDPEHVEAMRGYFIGEGMRGDAVLLSVLAYAGLRPESEALPLRWSAWADGVLEVKAGRKRGAKDRMVRVLEPLGADLTAWRAECGRSGSLVLPFRDGGVHPRGGPWSPSDWDNWRKRRWTAAREAAGLPSNAVPRDLRGSCASLLIWEGRSIIDVAGQLGHKPSMCLDTYAGEFARFDPVNRRPAADVIAEARTKTVGVLTV